MTAHPYSDDNQPAGVEGQTGPAPSDAPHAAPTQAMPVYEPASHEAAPAQASPAYEPAASYEPAPSQATSAYEPTAATEVAPAYHPSAAYQPTAAYEQTRPEDASQGSAYAGYNAYGSYSYPQSTGYPTQTLPPQQPPVEPPSGAGLGEPPPPRKRKRRVGVVALVAAACLIGGAAGGAVGAEVVDNNSSTPAAATAGTTSTGDSGTDDSGDATSPVVQVTGTVQGAAAKIIPSVVVIEVTGQSGGGSGSGVVMDTNGNIVTNAHVVQAVSNPTIEVTFSDGQKATATVVGVDASSDLAVINVQGISNLTPATFADSDSLQIGQTVVAVGEPLGLAGTVTQGIVSAVNRPVRTGSAEQTEASQSTVIDAIQTDAAINPGNSGGPLVNLAGEVVGINSAIATVGGSAGGESGNIGVGFSIPSNDVTNIADQLVKSGTAVHASLGVSVGEARDDSGPELEKVQAGSPAADAGLKVGDVITKVGDRAVYDVDSLLAAVRDHQPGDQVTITLLRGGDEQTVTVTMGSKEG